MHCVAFIKIMVRKELIVFLLFPEMVQAINAVVCSLCLSMVLARLANLGAG